MSMKIPLDMHVDNMDADFLANGSVGHIQFGEAGRAL